MEASKITAWDPDPFSVFVGCEFSMMHTFLTIEFNPAFFELFLPATRLMQRVQNDAYILAVSHQASGSLPRRGGGAFVRSPHPG